MAWRGDDIDRTQPADTNAQGLLTLREVATLLHVHPNSVRRWADLGLLPCYRVGMRGDRRFRPDDVAAFPVSQREPKRRAKRRDPKQ